MKSFICSIMLLALSFSAFSQKVDYESLSLSTALMKAEVEKKYVFIDAYTTWCAPCKQMDNTTLKEPKVVKMLGDNFISLKLDVERGEGMSVKQRYAVEGLPGYLFLDPDGFVVTRESGYKTTDEFVALLQKTLAEDKDNVGHLAARYENNKNDLIFLKAYLDKLSSAKATDYYEVVEQYLELQKDMAPESEAMVNFLAKHNKVLVYGGEADRIIKENFGTEEWDKYARKDIRAIFQALPRNMFRQTVEYSAQKKDTALLAVAVNKAEENGVNVTAEQKSNLAIYFYQKSGQVEQYRRLAIPRIDSFYSAMDVAKLQASVVGLEQHLKAHPEIKNARSNALIKSEQLRMMVTDFVKTAYKKDDKEMVMKWADRVYEVLPTDLNNTIFYAKCQFLYGSKEKGLQLMESALNNSEIEETKLKPGVEKDLALMKTGKPVIL